MTRGRRKDTTLPPSRALIIQRAYRDRKAKYVADLEDRCRKAEQENERLRKELELARSESAVASMNSELVNQGDIGLMENKLTRRTLCFKTCCRPEHAPISCRIWSERKRCYHSFRNGRLAYHPSQQKGTWDHYSWACLHPSHSPHRVMPSAMELDIAAVLTHALRQDPPAPESQPPRAGNASQSTGSSFDPTGISDDGSECCGGVLDCRGLIE